MLDMGFSRGPGSHPRHDPCGTGGRLLFSATLPREITNMAKRYQRAAIRIAATAEGEQHGDIEYRAVTIAPHEVERAVVNVLRYFESPRRAGLLRDTRGGAPVNGNLLERGLPRLRCRVSLARPSVRTRFRRCATDMPASVSPPTLRRVALTCRISASSSRQKRRVTPRHCSTAAAEPDAPAAKGTCVCWSLIAGGAPRNACSPTPISRRPGPRRRLPTKSATRSERLLKEVAQATNPAKRI